MWNMELMKKLIRHLSSAHPDTYILLGGPQVMNHAHKYLDANHERMLVCNGEGEKPFADFLRELMNDQPDFAALPSISYHLESTLHTNPLAERIKDLNEIPSPYLNGIFDDRSYRMTIFETNRGCPYHCSYCFWGAATNDRVYKFDEERIRAELSWISENKVPFLFFADANWGMLKRDVEFSEHIAVNKKKHGLPAVIFFSAAKNSPQRVADITRIFTDAGLINTQPVSMQSLNRKPSSWFSVKTSN